MEQWRDEAARADKALSSALQAVKPGLEFVKVRSDVAEAVVPSGARRGCWHVRDAAARPVPTFLPIAGEGGGYREPDSGVLTELRSMDLRRPEVAARVFNRDRREKERQTKAAELRKEQERDELKADLKAGWRVKGRIYRDDGSPVKRKR